MDTKNIEDEKKIFIFTCPYTGHCNPIFGVCKRLTAQNKTLQITVYGDKKFKTFFEKSGATFKSYKSTVLDDKMNANLNFLDMFDGGLRKADKNLAYLYDEVRMGMPDMVLYDRSPLYPKFFVEYIASRLGLENLKMFKIVGYDTTIYMDREYPNEYERKYMELNLSLKTLPKLVACLFLKRSYAKKYKLEKDISILDAWDPLDNETATLVFTFPQLRPRSHLLKNRVKFVGSSIDVHVHFNGLDDTNEMSPSLKDFLEQFPSRLDEQSDGVREAKFHLVYVSLGTIFNTDVQIFHTIVKALDLANASRPLKAIIAAGEACYDMLKEKYDETKFNNILFVKAAPQIEILQRASLFITHNGMNSTSEAIHFGVPMISLPMAMSSDQPLIAYRVSDELGLGMRFDAKKGVSCVTLSNAVVKVLSHDEGFWERALIFRDISRKYDGLANATKLIETILNEENDCHANLNRHENVSSTNKHGVNQINKKKSMIFSSIFWLTPLVLVLAGCYSWSVNYQSK